MLATLLFFFLIIIYFFDYYYYLRTIYSLSFLFLTNCRSKKNEEEKKKLSESILRYHDQIAIQTTNIAKLKEDLINEQQSKCLLEERLAKVGNQTIRLDEEIVQLKAMSNVNFYFFNLSIILK